MADRDQERKGSRKRPRVDYNLEKEPLTTGKRDRSGETAEGFRLAADSRRVRSRGWMIAVFVVIGIALAVAVVWSVVSFMSGYVERISP